MYIFIIFIILLSGVDSLWSWAITYLRKVLPGVWGAGRGVAFFLGYGGAIGDE